MGMYVDSKTAYTLYKKETKKPYFVDKSKILKELLPLVEEGGDYICITRPRRFGKTVAANMISAFFSRACDAADLFGCLDIAEEEELNMFSEFTMASEERFSEYFGFTEEEVDLLFSRYEDRTGKSRQVTRDWYDGYHTKAGERLYNLRSVVMSLSNNNLGNYWTSSGPYDEIYYYIEHNVDAVRDDLARMVWKERSIPAQWRFCKLSSDRITIRKNPFGRKIRDPKRVASWDFLLTSIL